MSGSQMYPSEPFFFLFILFLAISANKGAAGQGSRVETQDERLTMCSRDFRLEWTHVTAYRVFAETTAREMALIDNTRRV